MSPQTGCPGKSYRAGLEATDYSVTEIGEIAIYTRRYLYTVVCTGTLIGVDTKRHIIFSSLEVAVRAVLII